jgi:sugar phosphate isomerase/epimerase
MSLHALSQHWEAPFFARIIDKIDPNHIIDGFEINGDPDDPYECDYMITMAKLVKNYDRSLQFHSHFEFHNHYSDLEYLNRILSFYNDISSLLCKTVNLVLHPVDSYDTEIAISRTHKFLENLSILRKIHKYNISFSLENLNNNYQHQRLNTKALRTLIETYPDIHFCWDIGHEVSENVCTYRLNNTMRKALNNVHIHDIYTKDHYPFTYGNTDYKAAIDYLKSINYSGSLVTEINLAYLPGNSLLEKFRLYTDNIDLLKTYYDSISTASNTRICAIE